MRLPVLRPLLVRRFRRPATWITLLVFTGGWLLARLLAGVPPTQLEPMDVVVPFLLLAGHLALSPLPWQWTGDDRSTAPLWRGGLQALPWNAAWVCLLLLGIRAIMPHPPLPIADFPAAVRPFPPPSATHPPHPGPDWMLLFLNLPFAMVLGWFLSEKERSEGTEIELRERERITRTQALQSQLNPHVLFNVLAGLTEMVHEDPDAAERALVGLTELLRMLLQRASSLRLPLEQERILLRRYLEIESLRLGGRLRIHWDWEDGVEDLMLPPLLLQPLVENAIRHGIAPCPKGGGLCLEARRTLGGLVLRVSNTGLPMNPARKPGTGLGNLEERLRLAPELKATLELRTEGEWTVAELRLEGNIGP